MEQLVHQLYSHRHGVRHIREQRDAVANASCSYFDGFQTLSRALIFGDEEAEPLDFGMAP
jgi:hypothetical protein